MGGVGLIFIPVLVRHILRPSSLVWAYNQHFLDSWLLQTVLLEGLTCLQLPTRPLHPPHPTPSPTPLYVQSVILQWL